MFKSTTGDLPRQETRHQPNRINFIQPQSGSRVLFWIPLMFLSTIHSTTNADNGCFDLLETIEYNDLDELSGAQELAIDGDIAAVIMLLSTKKTAVNNTFYKTVVELYYKADGQWTHEYSHEIQIRPDGFTAYPNKRIDISGNRVIVASPDDMSGAINEVVHILHRDNGTWLLEADIQPEGICLSVAISGDTAVLGETSFDTGAGKAVVYRRHGTNWIAEDELVQPDGEPIPYFGSDVAIDDNIIMVTALAAGPWVYEYDGDNWAATQFIDLEDASTGHSVDLDGDTCVVGSYEGNADTAYVFRRQDNQWELEQELVSADIYSTHFGYAVRISDDMIVASSGWNYSLSGSSGKSHLFSRDNSQWEEIRIYESQEESSTWLASPRIGISGQQILIGAIEKGPFYFQSADIRTIRHDACECPDATDDGLVDANDVLSVIGSWGDCDPSDECSADVDDNGTVNVNDVLWTISEWGLCE